MPKILFLKSRPLARAAFLCSLLALIPWPVLSAEPPAGKPQEPAPVLTVDQWDIDFGPALPGQLLKHRFLLSNHTKQSVRIRSVTPSCYDVYADELDEIPPGATLPITMTFHAGLAEGDYGASTSIQYSVNGQESPDLVKIRMAARVGTLLSLADKAIDFGVVPAAQNPPARQMILNRGTSAFGWDTLIVTRMSAGLFATIVPGAEGGYVLQVSANAREASIGLHEGEVAIGFVKDGVRLLPEIKVPVFYEITSIVRIKPKSIFLGGVQVGERQTAQVAVVAEQGKTLALVDGLVEPRGPFAVVASEKGNVINFTVSCQPDALVPTSDAVFRAIVRVDDEEYTLCAPIIYRIIPKR